MFGFIVGLIFGFILSLLFRPRDTQHSGTIGTDAKQWHLTKTTQDLKRVLANNKETAAETLLSEYQTELKQIAPWIDYTALGASPVATQAAPYQPVPSTAPIKEFDFENWYKDNSINLFLYIGAFLIVASAGTFVGFNWQQLTGAFKAMSLVVLTMTFFGAGFCFYQFFPKLKPAGVTFLTLSAILIPFNGVAWYRFVLEPVGISYSGVWAMTSLIALLAYIFLYFYIKKEFFGYIIAFSALSLTESFVRIGQLNTNYYIFGAIITSYMLFAFQLVTKKVLNLKQVNPFFVSSNAILPLALVLGLMKLVSDGNIFTLDATVAVFLSSIFYGLSYYFDKRIEYYGGARVLLAVTSVFFTQSIELDHLYALYFVLISNYLVDSTALICFRTHAKFNEIRDFTLLLALIIPLGVFATSLSFNIDSIHKLIFAVMLSLQGIAYYYYAKQPLALYITNIFAPVACFIYTNQVLGLEGPLCGAIGVMIIALANYAIFDYLQQKQKVSLSDNLATTQSVFFSSFALLGAFATIAVYDNVFWHVSFVLILCLLSLRAGHLFKAPVSIFLTTFLYLYALTRLLLHYNIDSAYFPIFLTLGAIIPFATSYLITDQKWRQTCAVAGLFYTSCLYLYFVGRYATGQMPDTEIPFALTAALTTVMLYFIYTYTTRLRMVGYLAIGVSLITYYWFIHNLGVRESQIYIIPTAFALFALGYFYRTKNEIQNMTTIDVLGQFILFMPTFFQAMGADGAKYALLLGIEGVAAVAIGSMLQYRIFALGGAAAIFLAVMSQTYVYINSLPRWVVMLVVGIIFLAIATFLLQRRKEELHEENPHAQ